MTPSYVKVTDEADCVGFMGLQGQNELYATCLLKKKSFKNLKILTNK